MARNSREADGRKVWICPARDVFMDKQKLITLPYDVKLALRKRVFVPDEKTFSFINTAIELINRHKKGIGVIADVGTGSGVIAIYIAKKFPDKKVYAFDISIRALQLARYNVSLNRITNIVFFKNKDKKWLNSPNSKKIDMIVANPPYVGDLEYFSKRFLKEYPDAKYQPATAIRSYDRYGLRSYIGIFNAARKHGVKYILFRCNTESVDKINLILSKVKDVKLRKMKSRISQNSFLFVEIIY